MTRRIGGLVKIRAGFRECLGAGAMALVTVLTAQQPPDQSAAGVRAAPDLVATLWASEPAVTNPSNMAIDERGRVWVLEAVNYRRALRSQPDLRPEGDRIVILEDTNHDGKSDNVKVFDQNPKIRAPLGIAVLGDKVYVSQSPDVIVYTKDANDRIVNKEVLLTGFGGVDHDHGVHAIVFGPDGKLYFNHGNTGYSVKDRSGKTIQGSSSLNDPLNSATAGTFQGVSLRMNRDGTALEVLAQNFRNPYELTLDSFGNIFQTDNDDDGNAWTRLSYILEGGNYGFNGPLHRTWNEDRGSHFHNELPGVVPNVLRLGPGSPCGLLVYEGTLLPAKYRGQLMHAEAGKRIVAGYPLKNDGAGYTASIEDILFGGQDTWFRPSDVAIAPDGALFVADWYDPGVGGHNMGDPEGGHGRIYRVAPPNNKPQVPPRNLTSEEGLAAGFRSPNDDVRYQAYVAIEAQGAKAAPMLQRWWRQTDEILKARALWLLGRLPNVGPQAIQEALRDTDARFRVLGLRVARLTGADILAVAKPLLRDPSPHVRREITILLRDPDPSRMIPPYLMGKQVTPPEPWLDAMTTLIAQHDGKDRWYLEAIGIAARGREDALYARLRSQFIGPSNPQVQHVVWVMRPQTAIPDLIAMVNDPKRSIGDRTVAVGALGSMEWPEATRAIENVILANGTPPELIESAFAVYNRQLFSMWTDARSAAAFPQVVRKAFATASTQASAVDLATRLADTQFLPDLLTLARQRSAPAEARAVAIESLATTDDAKYAVEFRSLAASGPTPVRVSAVRAAGNLPQPDLETWAQVILLSDAPNEVRVEALRVMASSAAGLNAILDLAAAGKLPTEFKSLAANLTNGAGRDRGGDRNRGFASAQPQGGRPGGPGQQEPTFLAIRERAAKVLPLPKTTAGPLPNVQQLERNYRGAADAGRKVFETDAVCATCHSLGGPKKVGPDLSAIGIKFGKQAMLDHIVRPNDAIAPEYVMTTIELQNGKVVSGIVTEDTPQGIAIQVSETELRRLNRAEVKSRKQSSASLMPEGLLDALTLQQVSDLLEYLSTLKGQPTK
jgi:putative membrane-bound dehydrogenase-like protein